MTSFRLRIPIEHLCRWSELPRSMFYYKVTGGKPGPPVSTTTLKLDGSIVPNDAVVDEIKNLFTDEFATYGYEYTTIELQRLNYVINHKKVYRLMKENNLLLNKKISTTGKRIFVPFRTIVASRPMEYLSMDIKYVWVEGEQKNYYLLSIIDVYSRKVLGSILKASIRKHDVLKLLKRLNDRHSIKGVIIRNDNGPQFIANLVKNFLRLAEVRQEFSHPATPEDNSYIEAFHSILQRDVILRFEFQSYYEAKITIERFIERYNYRRPHRSIGFMTPEEKWQAGLALSSSGKPQNAQESLSRLMNATNEQSENSALSTGLDKLQVEYICLPDELNVRDQNQQINLNQFEKTVRIIGG